MPEGEGVLLNTAGWKLWHKLRAAVLRNAALNANDEKTFKFDSPEAVIPYCGLTGNGQAPMLYTQWAVSGGIVRFAGEEAKVKLPAACPVPRPTGHEKVSVSYKETPGDLGEWRAIRRDFRLQNDLNDYGLGVHSARCHGAKPRRTAWHVSNKGDMYDKDWAFLRDADFDGSAADKSKGIGPSFIRADLSSVEQAKTRLSDHYIQGIEYTLKPDAKRFRFLIWGNHGRPTTFGDMFKAFNASRRSFEFPSASG